MVEFQIGPKRKNRLAISPVIATLVLLAVTITVSVAVASYLRGITTDSADFEKLEIVSAYCTANGSCWILNFQIKNTGPRDASISLLLLNSQPIDFYSTGFTSGNWTTDMSNSETVVTGQTVDLHVYMAKNKAGLSLTPGTTVDVCFHSVRGMDYIKMVKLV